MSDSIEVLKSWHIEQCGKIKRDRLKRELSKGKPCYFLEGKLINKRQKRINALGDALLALEQKEDDRKQGALEELKKLLPRFETFESCEYKIKLIIEKRIKELEGDKK